MPGPQTEGTRDDRIETIWAGEAMRQLRSLKPPERPKPAPGAASLPAPPAGPGAPPMIAAPTAPIPAAAPTAGAMSHAGAPTQKKPKLLGMVGCPQSPAGRSVNRPCRSRLALRKLEAFARAGLAGFFTFLHPRIASKQPFGFERAA